MKDSFGRFWVSFPRTLNEVLIEHFSVSHVFAERCHCKLVNGRKKRKVMPPPLEEEEEAAEGKSVVHLYIYFFI